MKKIINETVSSKYLIYTQNQAKCLPEHLFLSDAELSDWNWVDGISDADQWDTLTEAVAAMEIVSELIDDTIQMEIVFLSADMTTVDKSEYVDFSVEAKRQLIFGKMSAADLKFLADNGLG